MSQLNEGKKETLQFFSLFVFFPPTSLFITIHLLLYSLYDFYPSWMVFPFFQCFVLPSQPPFPPPRLFFFTLVYLDCGWITKKAEMVIDIRMKRRLLLKTFMSICENVFIKTHWWGGEKAIPSLQERKEELVCFILSRFCSHCRCASLYFILGSGC